MDTEKVLAKEMCGYAQKFLQSFRQRPAADQIIQKLDELRSLRILVVGDAIVEVGQNGQAIEKSSVGGALACAGYAAGFCGEVHLVTVLGRPNSQEEFIRKQLKTNVQPMFFYRDDVPTVIRKSRDGSHSDASLPREVEREFQTYLGDMLPQFDAALVADYGYGSLSAEAVAYWEGRACFLAVNVQASNAPPSFNLTTKYPRADYLCVDEPGIRRASTNQTASLEEIIPRTHKLLGSKQVAVTRGRQGSIFYSSKEGLVSIPAFSSERVDCEATGEAFFAITALCAAEDFPVDLTGFIGNTAVVLAATAGDPSSVEPASLHQLIRTFLKS